MPDDAVGRAEHGADGAAGPLRAGAQQTAAAQKGSKHPGFQRLGPEATGVGFQIYWDKPAEFDRVFYSQNTGGGVTVADYDADGLPDVYLTRPCGGNRLYRNRGGFRFEDVTAKAGLEDPDFWGTGASFVDIDNDGDWDLYACCYGGTNRLYVNQGDGTFRQHASGLGLNYRGASVMMAFADYDQDGDLDGYLVTSGLPPGDKKFRVKFVGKRPVVRDELREYWDLLYLPGDRAKQIEAGQYDHLYRNDGPGDDGLPRFTDVSREAGIDGTDIGQSATWWDYDRDGLPDLYVANDYWGADRLYRNLGGGRFRDVAREALPHTPWSSMGADIGDLNQDGWMDLLATDMAGSNHFRQKVGMGDMASAGWFLEFAQPRQYSRNALYLNSGTHRFMEAAYLTDLAASDWTWTPRIADFDNDGRADVLITNGMTRPFTDSDLNELAKQTAAEGTPEFFAFWRKQDYRRDANLLWRNQGDLEFENVSQRWVFDRLGVSFGAATADFDGDGDLDIVVNNMDVPAQFYRNQLDAVEASGATFDSAARNHVLRLQLVGRHSNRSALGAAVTVTTDGGAQTQYLTLARGWTSTSECVVHFGLGDHDTATVSVRWPDGQRQQVGQLAANALYQITEPPIDSSGGGQSQTTTTSPPVSTPAEPAAMFAAAALSGDTHPHRDSPFDDFKIQPLLPSKMSQLGPGIACADLNGDGRDDYYLGGARGQAGQLLLSGPQGLVVQPQPVFAQDADFEDLGAVLFDVDGDGDLDLYVVSGGADRPPQHKSYQDRLYSNHDGQFTRAALPTARPCGGCVTAADFDRDGDLDLFVGGRVQPGAYPTSPRSVLWRNESGRLVDVVELVAPDLVQSGMVTDACWADVDNDGWVDLMVAYEWGPVRYFRNEAGRLVDRTAVAGLQPYTGWWNGITSGDVDGDGDLDFVVTNCGLNTKYHATAESPAQIYYGDYDGTGTERIVEAEFEGNKLYPVRGKSCSTRAIPVLGQRFDSYAAFGAAELTAIYTPACLRQAQLFAATTLQHGTLLNDGHGKFEFRPLPRIAQIAPAFGAVLADLNYDGNLDLALAQNSYAPQRETGHMDGGVGLVLVGKGDGTWQPVWPHRAGLTIGADASSLLASDVDADGLTDLLVGVNNGPWQLFAAQTSPTSRRILRLRLAGPLGNPTGIGARVEFSPGDGSNDAAQPSGDTQVRYVTASSGYLTQASAELVVALPSEQTEVLVTITSPSGSATAHRVVLSDAIQRVTLPYESHAQ